MNSSDFKISKTDAKTIFEVICPICDHKEYNTMEAMIRGLEYICEGCSAEITSTPSGSPKGRSAKVKYTVSPGHSHTFDLTVRTDSVWSFLSDDERSLMRVLDFDSDRAIALIVGSMIENRLKDTILERMVRNDEIENELFRASGALGPFSTKIHLARLMGLVSEDAYKDLVRLKDIRNRFAHYLNIRDFRSDWVESKAQHFKLVDSHVHERKPATKAAVLSWPKNGPNIWLRHAAQRKKRAKERYLMTAQLFTFAFAVGSQKSWPLPLI